MTLQAESLISWRRNLLFLWLVQLVTIIGLTFIFPFLPLFIQKELGVADPGRAALWSGIAAGAMGITLFFGSPIWGMLGDRYGRKKNLLRAVFGVATVLAVTGLSANVYQLVLFRGLGGLVMGTAATSMALVASTTPREKMGYVMGVLITSLFVGSMVGPLFGGFVVEAVGFRPTFFLAGGLVALAGVLVILFVREEFQRPEAPAVRSFGAPFKDFWQMATSRTLLPVLLILSLVGVSTVMMFPIFPVLIKTLGVEEKAASMTGIAFAILGVASTISAYTQGRLSARLGQTRVLALAAAGAGIFYIPLFFASTLPLFLLFLGLVGLFQGGLTGTAAGLIGLAVPQDRQGRAFGAVGSVNALAYGFGPLLGGALATGVGLRSVFLVQAITFFTTALVVVKVIGTRPPASEEVAADGQEIRPSEES